MYYRIILENIKGDQESVFVEIYDFNDYVKLQTIKYGELCCNCNNNDPYPLNQQYNKIITIDVCHFVMGEFYEWEENDKLVLLLILDRIDIPKVYLKTIIDYTYDLHKDQYIKLLTKHILQCD